MGVDDTARRLRAILENSRDWIWEMRIPDFCHTYSNKRLETILGYEPEEFRYVDFLEILHPEDRRVVERRMPDLIANEQGWEGWTIRARAKDGSYRYLESNASPMFDEHGEMCGFQGVDRDVTERVETEQRIRHAQKIQAIGQLAGGVAHDFANVLMVVSGELELLRHELERRPDSEVLLEHLDRIAQSTEHGQELTRQLLRLSRRRQSPPPTVDLCVIVRDMAQILRRLVGTSFEIEVDCDVDPIPVGLEVGDIEQLLLNLVVNARDASSGGGRIQVHAHALDGEAALRVSDEGKGMDANTRARVFEPYFTTKEPGKGTGLGLATVHNIVTQASGRIIVESILGEGTSFELRFPLSHSPETR